MKNFLLNEDIGVSNFGKVFLSLAAAWAVGRVVSARIRGSREQIDTIANAMVSSRRFQEELRKPGATPESVLHKLGLKNASAENFRRVLGIPWPL